MVPCPPRQAPEGGSTNVMLNVHSIHRNPSHTREVIERHIHLCTIQKERVGVRLLRRRSVFRHGWWQILRS
jgi:hypothetical protein